MPSGGSSSTAPPALSIDEGSSRRRSRCRVPLLWMAASCAMFFVVAFVLIRSNTLSLIRQPANATTLNNVVSRPSDGGGRPNNVTATTTESKLFPRPMNLLRRNASLLIQNYQSLADLMQKSSAESPCSCINRNKPECCQRAVLRSHKMGVELIGAIRKSGAIKPRQYVRPFGKFKGDKLANYSYLNKLKRFKERILGGTGYQRQQSESDFRVILVVRNIYDACVSGYLYHKGGHECWLGVNGEPREDMHLLSGWYWFIKSFRIEPKNRTLCQFLKDESEELGMRAYIEYVFRAKYALLLANYALAREFQFFHDRTRAVCFSALTSSADLLAQKLDDMLDFLYGPSNPSRRREVNGTLLASVTGYSGGHATSTDPGLRERLRGIVRKIDATYYGGDIEWFDSIFECNL